MRSQKGLNAVLAALDLTLCELKTAGGGTFSGGRGRQRLGIGLQSTQRVRHVLECGQDNAAIDFRGLVKRLLCRDLLATAAAR